jgi:prepilin-type N-terminal cleavage/methylation domain-containing protein
MKDHRASKGFSLIELLIVTAVLAIIAGLAIAFLDSALRAGREASAVSAVRTLVTAQRAYWWGPGNGSYGSLDNLVDRAIIDGSFRDGKKEGYNFLVVASPDAFAVTANPDSSRIGTRSFFSDESGIIRWRRGAGANASDAALGD